MENSINFNVSKNLDKPDNKKRNSIGKLIKNHKFFSIVLTTFIILSCLNLCLIYSFLKILDHSNFF